MALKKQFEFIASYLIAKSKKSVKLFVLGRHGRVVVPIWSVRVNSFSTSMVIIIWRHSRRNSSRHSSRHSPRHKWSWWVWQWHWWICRVTISLRVSPIAVSRWGIHVPRGRVRIHRWRICVAQRRIIISCSWVGKVAGWRICYITVT